MTSTIDVAARQAEVQRLFAEEQRGHPPLRGPEDVPGTPDALTVEWLTAVLCGAHDGAEVVAFEHGSQYDGTTSGRRLTILYNDAGREAGLPQRLFAKFSPSVEARCLVGINGSSAGEVAFYDQIRPTLPVETPRAFYAGFDEPSCRTFLLLEDLVQTKGARFGTALDFPVDRSMAESMVGLLAETHGRFWGPGNQPAAIARSALEYQVDFNSTAAWEQLTLAGFEVARGALPSAIYDRRGEWHAGLMRSLELNVAATPTLLHQDTHLANWYALPDGTMGLADWQCLARGQWALDVAYALAIGLTTSDRRAWEQELLALYLERLAATGVEAPTFDDAWLAYRQQLFHALGYWLAPIGIPEEVRPVRNDVATENIRRAAAAVEDLAAFDAL